MKILLISDTHRQIDPVNNLAASTGVDCCFHMGDFCAYTRDSVGRFSTDMLYKQLKHTPQLSPAQLAIIDREDVESMRLLAMKYHTYGNFEEYLSGKKRFNIPVYAVPGNNDDAAIIARLEKHSISNLTFLNETKQLERERFLICGIGGAIAERVPISRVGYVSTGAQISKLVEKMMTTPIKRKILLTHVPPYECEPLMRLVEAIKPVLVLCGHTHHWDDRMAGNCRILTLPCFDRGHAILELNKDDWNCQTYKVEREKI